MPSAVNRFTTWDGTSTGAICGGEVGAGAWAEAEVTAIMEIDARAAPARSRPRSLRISSSRFYNRIAEQPPAAARRRAAGRDPIPRMAELSRAAPRICVAMHAPAPCALARLAAASALRLHIA